MTKTRSIAKQPAGVFIIELMDERGLTNKKISELMGTTETKVSRLLTGKRGLDLNWLHLFAKALGVHISELFIPPGPKADRVPDEKEVMAILRRISGLSGRGIELAFVAVTNFLAANPPTKPSEAYVGDQSEHANHPRESSSSRTRS